MFGLYAQIKRCIKANEVNKDKITLPNKVVVKKLAILLSVAKKDEKSIFML